MSLMSDCHIISYPYTSKGLNRTPAKRHGNTVLRDPIFTYLDMWRSNDVYWGKTHLITYLLTIEVQLTTVVRFTMMSWLLETFKNKCLGAEWHSLFYLWESKTKQNKVPANHLMVTSLREPPTLPGSFKASTSTPVLETDHLQAPVEVS